MVYDNKITHVYYQIATFFEFLFFSTYRNSSYTKSQNVGVAQIDSPSSGDQKSREMKKCARLIWLIIFVKILSLSGFFDIFMISRGVAIWKYNNPFFP